MIFASQAFSGSIVFYMVHFCTPITDALRGSEAIRFIMALFFVMLLTSFQYHFTLFILTAFPKK